MKKTIALLVWSLLLARANAQVPQVLGIWELDLKSSVLPATFPLASETPHGGFKQSGFGKDLSAEAIGDYQITKHVMIAQ